MLSRIRITQQGTRHAQEGIEGQDFSVVADAGDGYVVAAIADGVSSASMSLEGARFATTRAAESVCDALDALDGPLGEEEGQEILRRAFRDALDGLDDHAYERELPLVLLDSTLTVTIYDGDGNLWTGHVGDDGIVAMRSDGSFGMVTTRHKGRTAHEVMPLRSTSDWEFGFEAGVASYVMMTDGMLDWCVAMEPLTQPVYLPLIESLLCAPLDDEEAQERMREAWDDALAAEPGAGGEQVIRDVVSDDITVVAVANSEMVRALPEIGFDAQAWVAERNAIIEGQERRLADMAERRQSEFNSMHRSGGDSLSTGTNPMPSAADAPVPTGEGHMPAAAEAPARDMAAPAKSVAPMPRAPMPSDGAGFAESAPPAACAAPVDRPMPMAEAMPVDGAGFDSAAPVDLATPVNQIGPATAGGCPEEPDAGASRGSIIQRAMDGIRRLLAGDGRQ